MQSRTQMLFAFSIFSSVGTATAFAAEMDVSKCPVNKQWEDAYNRGDAAAVAALYTPDAREVSPAGIRIGAMAVKERVEENHKEGMSNVLITATKCGIEGAFRWSSGTWKADSRQGPASGFWTAIEVKNGDAWKMQNLTWNLTPPPPTQK